MDRHPISKSAYLAIALSVVALFTLPSAFRSAPSSEAEPQAASRLSAPPAAPDYPPSRNHVRPPVPSVAMPEPLPEPVQRPVSAIDRLPSSEQTSFQAAIHQARHAITELDSKSRKQQTGATTTHFAANPGQDLRFHFLKDGGVRLSSGLPGQTWQGILRLKDTPASTSWNIDGARAERTTGHLTEWYVNREEGMEHGFTLRERPSTPPGQPVVLRMVLDELRTSPDPNRPGDLTFSDPASGSTVLSYRSLKVWDADQRQLSAEMRPTGDGFLIALNDTGARYPVTVDPLIASLEHQLQTTTAVTGQNFGYSTAVDGNNMAVGSRNGPVCLYQHNGTAWVLQQKIQVPPDRFYFGSQVALSGNQLAIVGYTRNEEMLYPQIYLHEKTGSTWTPITSLQPQYTFVPEDEAALATYGYGLIGSLALEGNMLAYGSSWTQNVVVYKKGGSGWTHDILIEQGANPLFFGHCIAISGETLVVGAPEYLRNNTGKVYVYSKLGNLWLDPVILTSPTPLAGENFGSSVAMSGNRIAVGARLRNFSSLSTKVGAVYPFQLGGGIWNPATPLANPSPVMNGQFGSSVVLDGNNLVVGSLYDDTHVTSTGSALYFTASGNAWTFQQKLSAPETRTSDLYAYSIDLSGTHLVAGAPGRDLLAAGNAGTTFTYSLAGGSWKATTTLTGEIVDQSAAGDNIGYSVDIDGNSAIVGAPADDSSTAVNSGSIYFLERSNGLWEYRSKFNNYLNVSGGRFGISVSISGNWAVAGADYNQFVDANIYGGTVAGFERRSSGWEEVDLLIGYSTPGNHQFGRSVDIDGETLVVGSPGSNGNSGSIFVFELTDGFWSRKAKFSSPAQQANAYFGFSVAISGNYIIAGEPRLDYTYVIVGPVNDCGAAHIYQKSGTNWPLVRSYIGEYTSERRGIAVALEGPVAVIGAGGRPGMVGAPADNPTQVGAAFVARLSIGGSWGNLTTLDASGLPVRSCFGASVAVDGNTVAVGAFGDEIVTGIVRTYQYIGNSWVRQQDITAPGGESDNAFGISVALSGETLAVGALGADASGGTDSGTAYLYRLAPPLPTLAITRSGTNAILTWTSTPGWSLHRSSSLLPESWVPVTVTTDGTHTHAISPTEPRMFFRLQHP